MSLSGSSKRFRSAQLLKSQPSEVLERSATVEIKAKRTELGYSDLEPSKVSLVPSPFPDLGTSADAV
jgi:hypothetical protein